VDSRTSDGLVVAVKRIQKDNPTAAWNVARAVVGRIEELATLPGLGRPGEVNGTRVHRTGADDAVTRGSSRSGFGGAFSFFGGGRPLRFSVGDQQPGAVHLISSHADFEGEVGEH